MNSSINIKEIGFELENFLAKTTSGPNGFAGECYRTLKEEIIPILSKLPENRRVHFRIHYSETKTRQTHYRNRKL